MILTVTLNTSVDKLYVLNRLRPHEVMRVGEVNNTAGGKGLNVSRAAALLGERVAAMGFVGGHNGALFESLIREDGIEKRFTHVRAETRSCINVRDLETNRSTEFLEPGNPVTAEEVQNFLRDFEAELPSADVVTISGSMPKGVPPDFYASLIETARRRRKPVLLDTSGAALKNALAAKPALIKPNADEIRGLLHADASSQRELIAAAERLHQGGVSIVAVSLGKEGVLVVCGGGVYRGVTPDVPVVNTVGCGDSMVGAFAVGLARRTPMEEAIRCAVAVSTANALTKATGFFHQKDLMELLPRVRVERLEPPQ
ncbi:MAG TPA: 1-phosphofructokinase [Ruminococcaceae bacterium]|jgi:tagatose 6-phosphate kinase|nr:1-phosphofructokinase [Oscillospiraceae bacterium]